MAGPVLDPSLAGGGELPPRDTGLAISTGGYYPGSGISIATRGYLQDEAIPVVTADQYAVLVANYLALLLDELPPNVYADSGQWVTLPESGFSVPVELHKRELLNIAYRLADYQVEVLRVVRNQFPQTAVEDIDLWELTVLGTTYPLLDLGVRQQNVARRLRLKGHLSVPYIRQRCVEVLGYEPDVESVVTFTWTLNVSSLGDTTNLGSGIDSSYIYEVRLPRVETDATLALLDGFLTKIEPARSKHHIINGSLIIQKWRVNSSALGVTTALN